MKFNFAFMLVLLFGFLFLSTSSVKMYRQKQRCYQANMNQSHPLDCACNKQNELKYEKLNDNNGQVCETCSCTAP